MSSEEQEAIFDSSKEIKWGGWLNEFLWVCAGVNRKVLRQCPTDYAKYAGIGGTILFTALMACLSGGYALSFVFDNDAVGVAFGIFWGMLIFNLDRFIVNTMYSDGKVTISARELKAGLPRIIMAIFLGLVISAPLEMRIFHEQIDAQLKIDNAQRTQDANKAYQYKYDDRDKKVACLDKIKQEEKTLRDKISRAQEDLKKEGEGTALSGKVGHGQIYKDKQAYLEQCEDNYASWKAQNEKDIKSLENQLATLNTEIDGQEGQNKKTAEGNGFAVRYEAFKHVTDWDTHPNLAIVSLMITLLFVIIETAPTFLKMMIASGPYDDLLRAEMHRVRVLSDKRISDINDEVNTSVEISVAKNKERLEAEMAANKEVLTQVAVAQARLIEYAIKEWEKVERTKIEKEPSAYIRGFEPTVEVSSNRAKKGKKHRGRKVEQSVPTEIHGRESETSTEPEAVDEPENTTEPQPGNE